jgi:hypothetical protein
MSIKITFFGLIVVAVAISGCAGMSSNECAASDWSAVGFEDGSRGYTTDQFGKHRKACAKHGVTADFQSYKNGREQGLQEYCQPGRGYSVGVNGGRYRGVCSVDQEASFLDAYNTGYHLYTLRSNVNRATSQINSKSNEQKRIEDRLIANGTEMIAAETTKEERIHLLAELKNLSERTGQLEAEIEELYVVRARSQAELENYQLMVADLGY